MVFYVESENFVRKARVTRDKRLFSFKYDYTNFPSDSIPNERFQYVRFIYGSVVVVFSMAHSMVLQNLFSKLFLLSSH